MNLYRLGNDALWGQGDLRQRQYACSWQFENTVTERGLQHRSVSLHRTVSLPGLAIKKRSAVHYQTIPVP